MPVTPVELFQLVTKETPETFHEGKLVQATVQGFAFKKLQKHELEHAKPLQLDDALQCPFCYKIISSGRTDSRFRDAWQHFDEGLCEGKKVGVRCRLDNGCNGFINLKFLSDKPVKDPEERVRSGMTVWCRIMKIDLDRFQVDLTCRSSDLADRESKYMKKDSFWDEQAENADKLAENGGDQNAENEVQKKQLYMKRVISHPAFKNITYGECEAELHDLPIGEAMIRPSSHGPEHLTLTWKVAEGVFQHVDIIERDKQNVFSLGRKLVIGDDEYEDLDEILARFVQPMANHVRELMAYKYYVDSNGGDTAILEGKLYDRKSKDPASIPYYLSATREYPGKFLLSYMPGKRPRHEFVTVTPDGFRFRKRQFPNLNATIKWFKDHFSDPLPQMSAPLHQPVGTSHRHGGGASIGHHGTSSYSSSRSGHYAQQTYAGGASMAHYATSNSSRHNAAQSLNQGIGEGFSGSSGSSGNPLPYQQQGSTSNRGSAYARQAAPQVPQGIPGYQQPSSGYRHY